MPVYSFAIAQDYDGCYKHRDTPTLIYKADKASMTLQFSAREDIKPNQQLSIHYNQLNNGTLPEKTTWFKGKKIRQAVS
jgi:hypothetical protein